MRALSLVVLVALAAPAAAQPGRELPPEVQKLYEHKPVVELVTMGVGGLIWERHGHIALCVRYDNPREDTCYNYGIGDFRHPLKMTWGFFRAANSFWVGRQKPREMMAIYTDRDRSVWVQPLPLTPEQVQKVITKLEHDVLEENKHYSYDHFWDNCTTRVRDVIDDATGGVFKSMNNPTDGRTFRDLAREGFHGLNNSWLPLLITDIAMGRVTDHVPTYYERMFLPDYLREAVIAKWGIKPIPIYERRGPPAVKEIEKRLADGGLSPTEEAALKARLGELTGEPSGRLGFFLVVLLLTAPAWATRLWGRFQRVGLAVALGPGLFLGTVLWLLAIVSPLPYVRWNESCLCLMPFDALLLFLPADKRRLFARGRVVMLGVVGALLLVGVLEMPIWPVWLWGLVPCAVVGFWPAKPTPEAIEAPGEVKKKAKRK